MNFKNKFTIYVLVKNLFDRVAAIIGIFLILPVVLLISIAIFVDDPGPVIFKQKRAGRWNMPFIIYKFRTMRQDTPHLSTEEMRKNRTNPYTRLGPFLRKTSLDELPQLFNVLRGEMSLVGPRPALLTQSAVLQGREQLNIHRLRPGMTGLAQITGRDDLNDQEKVAKDNLYLLRMNLSTDLIILFFTLRKLFGSKGAY